MPAKILPEIDRLRCTGCGDCVDTCPQSVLAMQTGFPIFANPSACTFCADCEEHCPTRAIRCAFEIGWEDLPVGEARQPGMGSKQTPPSVSPFSNQQRYYLF